MKKIGLFLLIALVGVRVQAQEIKSIQEKIDALKKQKDGIDGEIKKLEESIPKPVEPNWKYKGNFALNFGQNLLGNDWSSAYGANSNLNLQGVAHFEANYKKGKHTWDNGFDGRYGFIKNFDDNNTGLVYTDIAKNADMLQLYSKYLYDLNTSNLKIGMGLNFLSQFTKTRDLSSNKIISDFLAPGILDIAPGIQWEPYPFLKIFFAPAMGRMTFVTNDTIIMRADPENRYGNDIDQRVRAEVGAKADIVFEKEVVKNLVIRSRAQLFNNWSRPEAQLIKINSSRTNIDVNWQTDIFYKLTKNLALNFGFQTIYDDDVRVLNSAGVLQNAQFQWRQNFGVGFVAGF